MRHGYPLEELTFERAGEIYRKDYWRFDLVRCQAVATKLLDASVNFGLRAAVRILQHALRARGTAVAADGLWGPQTLAAANAAEPEPLLLAIALEACRRYVAITRADKTQLVFLAGWIQRAIRMP